MTKQNQRLLIIGGSDAGISCGLRVKELNANIQVTILLQDQFPNLSICGIPYAIGGEVTPWQNLAHRSLATLQGTGINFVMNTTVREIRATAHQVVATHTDTHQTEVYQYDQLLVGTGARPLVPAITGLDVSHARIRVLHTMADYFAIEELLSQPTMKRVAILGSGYIGLEMAEALRHRNLEVTIFQRGGEVLSTLDGDLGKIVHQELLAHDIEVITEASVSKISPRVAGISVQFGKEEVRIADFDLLLVVTGVTPNSELLEQAGATLDKHDAVQVDDQMHTSLKDVWAAGDLVATKHRLLNSTYLPLGTTSHKQGRVAGSNIAGHPAVFQGVVGTQVLKIFGLVAARTGLTTQEARAAGFDPIDQVSVPDDHKAYIPGSKPITIKIIGDRNSGRLLGAQLIGAYGSEVAKRNDIYAVAIYNGMSVAEMSDLDLSYSPPLGAPWDAVQAATQAWEMH
ncbi:FAD-dependent oxidoreductase [Lacticaseibacillus hulanensis]|uniref:FAD-dependent oxidoreductase n=1 Tax=Lacticaseibacillus hulanensis TaxID=2493111 RepID=UPI000FD97CC3|nr:FAD-dependent oxidoreductase [Lacticaseibacillus hulanensis]